MVCLLSVYYACVRTKYAAFLFFFFLILVSNNFFYFSFQLLQFLVFISFFVVAVDECLHFVTMRCMWRSLYSTENFFFLHESVQSKCETKKNSTHVHRNSMFIFCIPKYSQFFPCLLSTSILLLDFKIVMSYRKIGIQFVEGNKQNIYETVIAKVNGVDNM